jgi:hypothetical protein
MLIEEKLYDIGAMFEHFPWIFFGCLRQETGISSFQYTQFPDFNISTFECKLFTEMPGICNREHF